jgi:hypothetical protein
MKRKKSTVTKYDELVKAIFVLNQTVKELIHQNNEIKKENYHMINETDIQNRAGPFCMTNENVLELDGHCPNPKMRKRVFHSRRKEDVGVSCIDKFGNMVTLAYHNNLHRAIEKPEQMRAAYMRRLIGQKQFDAFLEVHKHVSKTEKIAHFNFDYVKDGIKYCRNIRMVPCSSNCRRILCFGTNAKEPESIKGISENGTFSGR